MNSKTKKTLSVPCEPEYSWNSCHDNHDRRIILPSVPVTVSPRQIRACFVGNAYPRLPYTPSLYTCNSTVKDTVYSGMKCSHCPLQRSSTVKYPLVGHQSLSPSASSNPLDAYSLMSPSFSTPSPPPLSHLLYYPLTRIILETPQKGQPLLSAIYSYISSSLPPSSPS